VQTLRDKIRALLEVAHRPTTNPHEAETAMRLAQQLMHKHGIEVTREDPETSRPIQSPIFDPEDEWRIRCVRAAANLYGAFVVQDKKLRYVIVGRPHVIEATRATGEYLMGQVDRWYKSALSAGLSKSERGAFRRDFRNACSMRLQVRSEASYTAKDTGQALTVQTEAQALQREAEAAFTGKCIATVVRPMRATKGAIAGHVAADSIPLAREVIS